MATNDKASDLDIFEGLTKKGGTESSSGAPSGAPPPRPPPSAANSQHTLMGMTAPTSLSSPSDSGSHESPAARPAPPPGRGSLPPIAPAFAQAAAKTSVDVDWDDEDEATHIFDKAEDLAPRSRSAPTPAAGAPPPAAMKATLLGLTPPPGSNAYQGARFTPPPPPPTSSGFSRRSSIPPPPGPGTLPPPAVGTLPPPSLTLQGLGGLSGSRSIPPPPSAMSSSGQPMMGMRAPGATMPPARSGITDHPQLRAVLRSTEETALLRPPQNRASLWVLLGLVAAVVVGAVLLLMPHTGRAVINVTDPRGSSVGRVDIFVDGRKQCDTAPCIVEQLSSGTHEVKVLADGYDVPPAQGINVESRKDSLATFALGGASKGTGIKVSGTQPGVKLYVDDKEIGPLPQDYRELTPGDHVVKIVGSERYQPLERRVTLEKDRVEDLGSVTLKVLKGKATISLATPGARVYLVAGADRRELPMLPISVDIDTTKTWALQAGRPGYGEYNQPISFDDGQAEKAYVVSLEPRGNQVTNSWMPAAQPATGGAPAPAPAPMPLPQMAPRPAPMPVPVAAAPQPAGAGGDGFLNINSIPPSTAFLDGRQLGPTPKVHVAVSPGVHQVKFVNAEQQLTKTISVTVGAGDTKLAVAKLSN
jgi:hypothetical protein